MMFGVIVRKRVLCSRTPGDSKLLLVDSVDRPIEPHIDSLGSFGLDGFIEKALGCFVIGKDRRRRLRVAHI